MRLLSLLVLFLPAFSQQLDPLLYSGMRWRQIGPFRAGRVSAVAGIPGNAATYYMGTPGGGAWKTVDAGTVWTPISDSIPVASIGAIVVSPSNPDIVYMGMGDVSNVGGAVNEGNGVYKSIDAGKTWTHIGLDETEHIGAMWIDPHDPNIVFAAALGKTFAPHPDRGVYKTVDGGKTWRKVLYKDDTMGAVDISFAADNPKIGLAAMWYHYVKPGNARAQIDGTGGGGIYKTTDGGETWAPLTEGLPKNQIGRIGVAVAPDGKLAFAIVAAGRGESGLYRTDDGGATWTRSTKDTRIQGSGYFSRVFIDPQNHNVVYVAQTSLYRSDDGGRNFSAYKGAPGGDDNHMLWIDPTNSDRMILASDQGATISMDRGLSWTSWYNQPTGQIYHLSVDNRYPYWVYGTQQDSGAIGTLSRGDYGNITFMDWDPVAGYEFGYIIPDPLNPNMIFSGAPARGLVKIDRTNRQTYNISPNVSRDGDYRTAVNPPLIFSPQDPHTLYWGTQYLMETKDAGKSWKHGADLTKRPETAEKDAKPAEENPTAAIGVKPKAREADETVRPPDRSAVNTLAPSTVKAGEIWAGTTNGLVQLTLDAGATWQPVTPPGLTQYSLISMLEASHFDAGSAYVAIDRHEENDSRPHILRTKDYGKTWQETVAGIPARSFVRVVREDPARKGLLYAGTETATYVSIDDGDHWSTLQLNMPTTSVRDMVVHGDDLVVATYGRAFWILDDLTPLRQIDGKLNTTFLFKPEKALRVRRDQNGDTPIPPELPAGTNPPDGALIDYYLKATPGSDIKMAIYDAQGKLVRELSSKPEPKSTEPPPNVPEYWLAHPEPLSLHTGLNRFVWDLRYDSPPVVRHEYPISALYENTPAEPVGAIALPGKYEVRLTVDGKTYTQPLELTLDPRVDVTPAALAQEFDLEQTVQTLVAQSYEGYHQALVLHDAITALKTDLPMVKEFDAKVMKFQGSQVGGPGGGGPAGGRQKPTFVLLNRELGSLATAIDSADAAPTEGLNTAYQDYCKDLTTVAAGWNDLLKTDLPALNAELSKQHLGPLSAQTINAPSCK
jgi:photosystem II stability/assembly factor-like uncharacterized protein